jgi:hypothetical protein
MMAARSQSKRKRGLNRSCEFGREFSLPILAVDDPIYRRLPCFIIATVDKFALLPSISMDTTPFIAGRNKDGANRCFPKAIAECPLVHHL